jgi:Arc/MetJ-type ribon-helix-helix transcriptional regulator
MTIEITKPEVEALINRRLKSGGYKDAEDVIAQALRATPEPPPEALPRRSLAEVFEANRGLADDIDFSRNPSSGRPVNLG